MNVCVKDILIVKCASVRLRETAFNALTMNTLFHGTTRYQLPKLCSQIAQQSSTLLFLQLCAIRDQNVKITVTNVDAQIHCFCHDDYHFYFSMGDRYCDGVEDPAWQFINKPECPKRFDELNCPMRFECKAEEKLSVDVLQICNGITDCNDHFDEKDCADTSIFSSSTEMIAEPVIKAAFWIIGFVVVFGNFYVIVASISIFKKKKTLQGVGF